MIRTLSCHCGAIRLETNADLGELTECNCSTCGRHGFLHWRIKPNQVRLLTTRRVLSTYMGMYALDGTDFRLYGNGTL